MLSLPWAFAKSSLIGSILVLTFATFYCIVSSMIIVRCSEMQQIFSYDRLLRSIPNYGPTLERLGSIIIVVHIILSCASYVVLAGDTFVTLFESSDPSQVWLISATGVTLLIYFPTCLLDFSQLSFISAIGLLSVFYIFFLVIFLSSDTIKDGSVPLFEINVEWCSTASLSVQSYLNTASLVPIYKSLKDRSPAKFYPILSTSYAFVFVLYLIFALFASYDFGSAVKGNVLLSMTSSFWVSIGRFGVFISIVGSFPLLLAASTASIEQMYFNGAFPSFSKKFIFVAIQCLAAYLVGIMIPNLGVVNVINGALATATLFGVFPALMAIFYLQESTFLYTTFACFGITLGIFAVIPLL